MIREWVIVIKEQAKVWNFTRTMVQDPACLLHVSWQVHPTDPIILHRTYHWILPDKVLQPAWLNPLTSMHVTDTCQRSQAKVTQSSTHTIQSLWINLAGMAQTYSYLTQ